MRSSDFYIDLGTSKTLIYVKAKGVGVHQPSLMAYKLKENRLPEIIAGGDIAKRMLGKTPAERVVLKPLKMGVISDFESATHMLHYFLENLKKSLFLQRPRILISLPHLVTAHEKNAVKEVGRSVGASSVGLIFEPMSAALGVRLSVFENKGQMIIDIGGGTTEVAIISAGGIVISEAVRIGGVNLDEMIVQHLRERYRFEIGEQTAEFVKIKTANANWEENQIVRSVEIGGIDLNLSLPRRRIIDSYMIYKVVKNFSNSILSIIKKAFERCPPELAGDIAIHGILLTGGGALIFGIADFLSLEVGVPVKVCSDPEYAVAKGGARLLEDNSLYDRIEERA